MANENLRTQGYFSLFNRQNKKKGSNNDAQQEGLIEEFGELTLDKSDEELLELTNSWEISYSGSKTKARIHEEGDICERYWIGKQFPDTEYENGKRPLTDNVIFPNFETLIAQQTQQNPEPIVLTDDSVVVPAQPPTLQNPQGIPAVTMSEVGDKIHMSLEYLARHNNLKGTLKTGTRHWGLRFLGCWQTVWNDEEQEIDWKAINPKDLILDKNAFIKNGKYHGEFIGVRLNDTAQNLITRFPKKEKEIRTECQDKLGSLMGYIQWRTDEYVVYTMKKIVLLKHKNENWNYDKEEATVGPNGEPITQTVPGHNHWIRPQMPFRFLVVFNLQDEPADKTGLVQQALVTQDNINKGLKQYDRNADHINGGVVVNGLMFNKEQAAQVAEARRQGRTIVTPGKPEDAIYFPDQTELPSTLYQRIQDDRQQIMNRMGTAGTTSQGTQQEETVGGKIIAGQDDASRTGGGPTEALEMASAGLFDDALQFMYVFWDTPHWVSVIGPDNAEAMMQFQASDIPPGKKIVVAVQDGSLVPQDQLSIYNEAMQEYEAGLLDPLTYFEKTKDPNPLDSATKLMLFKSNPDQYMVEVLNMPPPAPPPVQQPTTTSGAPPASTPPSKSVPSPVQMQRSSLAKEGKKLINNVSPNK